MDELPRLTLGLIYGSGLTLVTKGKDIVILPVLIGLLGLQGYGEFIQIILIGSMLSIFVTCGMDVAIVRFGHQTPQPEHEMCLALTLVGIAGIVVSLAWMPLGAFLASLFKLPAATVLWGMIIAVIESLRGVSIGYYRSTERYGRIGLFFIALEIAEVITFTVVLLLAQSAALELVVWTYIGIRSVPAILSLIDIRPSFRRITRLELRSRFGFGLALLPKEIILWLGHSADRFIVSHSFGAVLTGVYTAAYKLASVVKLVSQPITFISFPKLARAWDQKTGNEFFGILKKSIVAYLVLAIPILLLLLLAADPILGLLSGQLRGNGEIVMWVAVGMLFHTLQGISSYYVFVLAGRVPRYTITLSAVFIAGLILQIFLINMYGLRGAAIGSFIIYFSFWLFVTRDAHVIMRGESFARV